MTAVKKTGERMRALHILYPKEYAIGEKMTENSITFTDENNEEIEFEILEQTTLGGINYLLVAEASDNEEDGSFLILREEKTHGDDEMAEFDIVDDDKELSAVMKIFNELLEDIDLEV